MRARVSAYIYHTWRIEAEQIPFSALGSSVLRNMAYCPCSCSGGGLLHLLGAVSCSETAGCVRSGQRIRAGGCSHISLHHPHVCVWSVLLSIHNGEPAPLQHHV